MNENPSSAVSQLTQTPLSPQESPAVLGRKSGNLKVGIPKEAAELEKRTPLKPSSVGILVANGHHVMIESKAGEQANFSDQEYSEAGAEIVYSPKEVYNADVIVKVDPPRIEEVNLMKQGATLISAFQASKQSVQYLNAINKKRVTALGYEFIQDKVGGLPLVRAMSEIAGSSVMLIAAEYLSSAHDGRGIIVGGITGVPPTRVVILGSGTVAEFAARASLGLGAEVRVFDNHIYKMRRLKHSLGREVFTSTFDMSVLEKELESADVLVGAVRAEKGRTKVLVTEEMVANMKQGSVIIDVSIDQGGCIDTSELTNHKTPTFVKHVVTHYCVPNIASAVARTASLAISNILTPILLDAGDSGGFDNMIYTHRWLQKGVYSYKGTVTSLPLAKRFDLPYKDLGLFMDARI
ncbi:MAG: alanine dehydrogenase [Bacteroidota bacterium]